MINAQVISFLNLQYTVYQT